MDWTGGGKGTPLCFLGPCLMCQAGRQHTELLEDFSPLILWVSHPGPRQLEDQAAHKASEERLYYQTGLKNRGPVCVEHLRGAASCLALDWNSTVTSTCHLTASSVQPQMPVTKPSGPEGQDW